MTRLQNRHRNSMPSIATRFPALFACVGLLWLPGPLSAQAAAGEAFGSVTESRERAEAAEAPVLSPGFYQEGVRALERARRETEAGRNPDRYLAEASQAFRQALDQTRVAALTFETVLDRREAARDAEAWRTATGAWQRAENEFADAARRLERGDLKAASERGAIAAASYDAAELQALRNRYLAGARSALLEAEQANAGRHAPRTLASARELLARADAALDANRRNPDAARELIEAAGQEAARAARVAELARGLGGRDRTPEDLILELEDIMDRMARAAGLPGGNVAGDPVAADELVAQVGGVRARAESAERELAERNRRVAGLEEELREMDDRLGGATAERDQLVMTMAAQERLREQLAAIEALFTPGEGQVVREGGNLIVRLTGLNFRPGSASLPAGSDRLLGKAEQAVALFPRASVVIEGHTDSTGSEEANRRLSEQRAQAVEAWLRGRLQLPAGRLQVIGYGPGRPVARNDTADGRSRNRRIDIVITPPPGTAGF